MAVLTPGNIFAETVPVGCGEDTLELHNPTVEEVADIRAALVASIQQHCAAPYSDALQNEQVLEHLTREAIPPMRDLMWREYGMPADDQRLPRGAGTDVGRAGDCNCRRCISRASVLMRCWMRHSGVRIVREIHRPVAGSLRGNWS